MMNTPFSYEYSAPKILVLRLVASTTLLLEVLTTLKVFQVLPQNVSHPLRSPGQKVVFAHGAHLSASHIEFVYFHTLHAELIGGPAEPMDHVHLRPLPRICNGPGWSGQVRSGQGGERTAAYRSERVGFTRRRRILKRYIVTPVKFPQVNFRMGDN